MLIRNKVFNFLFARRLTTSSQVLFRLYHQVHKLKQPIFIIGLNRSGTTIFSELFGRSKGIANWIEANEVWDPIGYPFEDNKLERPFWPIDPQGYTDSVFDSISPSYSHAIPGIFSMFTDIRKMNGAVKFVNKSPMNTLRLDYLEQLFPDAFYISIVRDPRAVVRSWAQKIVPKLEKHPLCEINRDSTGKPVYCIKDKVYTYSEMIDIMSGSYKYVVSKQLDWLEEKTKDRVYHFKYEEFSDSVHEVIQRIDEKFELDSRLRNWDVIPEKLESKNYKYKEELSLKEIKIIEINCFSVMKRIGYSTS